MPRLTSKLKNSEESIRAIALLSLLYLILSVQAMLPIDDLDIWWRFRTGQWIVENHSVPLKDYFSSYARGTLWIEYSWLFSLLVYSVHALFSLPGVVYLVVAMALMITFTAHQLVRKAGLPLPAEAALVAAAMGAITPLMRPRPWLFTIIFFAVELSIIDRVRRSGTGRLLWILPLLFVLWANLHIQFVYGLAALGLLFAESLVVISFQWFGRKIPAPALSPVLLALVLFACITATFLTPYHYLLYKQILDYVLDTGAFLHISELHPMLFRSPDNWLVLLLTISTAFVLGWRRRWLPFPTLLFLMGTFLAFRARRDAWVLALTAIWVIGDSGRAFWHGSSFQITKGQVACSVVAVAAILFGVSFARQISEANLQATVEKTFPVRAVNYINANGLPGPVFNDYDWGGFLLWSLRGLPVVVDGRFNLYGDEWAARIMNTWGGGSGWESDPDLRSAKLVIADKRRVLASLLRAHPRYKIVYEDSIAAVFVPVH
ncbi:MAG: hypothetical protein GEU77_16165 [Deltaproteobacteria bacterium]|nr:hypothetical protein [Deltaproteobacteria bacterium]